MKSQRNYTDEKCPLFYFSNLLQFMDSGEPGLYVYLVRDHKWQGKLSLVRRIDEWEINHAM
jgi:hypothetical protein